METRKRKAESDAAAGEEAKKKRAVDKQMGWRKNLEGWEREKFNIRHNFQNSRARALANIKKTKKWRDADAAGQAALTLEVQNKWSDDVLNRRIEDRKAVWQSKNGPIEANTTGWTDLEKAQGTKFNPEEIVGWEQTDFFRTFQQPVPNDKAPSNEKPTERVSRLTQNLIYEGRKAKWERIEQLAREEAKMTNHDAEAGTFLNVWRKKKPAPLIPGSSKTADEGDEYELDHDEGDEIDETAEELDEIALFGDEEEVVEVADDDAEPDEDDLSEKWDTSSDEEDSGDKDDSEKGKVRDDKGLGGKSTTDEDKSKDKDDGEDEEDEIEWKDEDAELDDDLLAAKIILKF